VKMSGLDEVEFRLKMTSVAIRNRCRMRGGRDMSAQRKDSARLNSSDLIWVQLSAQRQQQVVRLIAYLALKLVIAQTDNTPKEVKNGLTAPYTQDPN
jgi:hypothetical protein